MDPVFFDAPTTSSRNIVPGIVPPITDPQSWTRYYERREPGTSTDVVDTDEAQQTTSLILQEASVMVARGDDETPLIYSTQTAATVADLEMEDENREPNTCRLTGEGTELTVSITGSAVVTPASGVTKLTNVLQGQVIPQAHSGLTTSTVTSVIGAPVLPTSTVNQPIQPYNSSLMYEDNRLPAYVDYLGSILPILDQQSVANWPGTPHPLTGQVWIMPYNAANLPTVPYVLNIGGRGLLPEPIRGQSALSEVASTTSYGAMSSSVSNPIGGRPSGAVD